MSCFAVAVLILSFLLGGRGQEGTEICEEFDLEKGKRLYEASCQRCHGDSGDETDYYGIVPLAGFARRPPLGLVAQFREPSFYARGERFEGVEARSLTSYLSTLVGAKGFPDPGWLFSSYLLNRKRDLLSSCRVIDIRPESAYQAGHIPNAVLWEGPLPEEAGLFTRVEVTDRLGKLGILPATQIVVYDGQGGETSAWLWWAILQAGYPYVAILDGGWAGWVATGYEVSREAPVVKPTKFRANPAQTRTRSSDRSQRRMRLGRHSLSEPASQPVIAIDSHQMRDSSGLLTAQAILTYLKGRRLEFQGSYRVEGHVEEMPFLLFVLHLLGHSAVNYDPDSALLYFD